MKNNDFVLIIEDDKKWRDAIKPFIRNNFEIECKFTTNYKKSISILNSATPIAVILDLNLGNDVFNESTWGGWYLARAIKEKHIPFLIVTAHSNDERIIRAFKDFRVVDFFDKKDFANRIPDFIKDIEGIIKKRNNRKTNSTKIGIVAPNVPKQKTTLKPIRKRKSNTKSVFISYSHKDRNWLDKFIPHLKVLANNNRLTVWDDTKIKSGAKWKNEIQKALSTADIGLLLVTPDFLASEFIKNIELPALFNAAEKKRVTILWVAVKPSMYEEVTYISEFQSANDPDKPLANLTPAKSRQEIVQICKKVLEATK
jgi:CheY-like chemotaxis protein